MTAHTQIRINEAPLKTEDLKRDSKPMRWAQDKATGRPVSIWDLSREMTGRQCGCVCPGCDQELEAVNAGRPLAYLSQPNTVAPHFRHPSGHESDQCKVLVAKFTALQLLLERGEIELPAPVARRTITGTNGGLHTLSENGQRSVWPIRNKVWLDRHSAKITLPDGREILFLIESRHRLDDRGNFSGVIVLNVDDPEVASLTAEELLARTRLDGEEGLLCWEKHWDDDQLQAGLNDQVDKLAMESGSVLPVELQNLAKLSGLHQNEGVLHWKVKEILKESKHLMVPGIGETLWPNNRDLGLDKVVVKVPAQWMVLSDVRLEVGYGNFVPDVVCTAKTTVAPIQTMELLVEVAVHHPVDAVKKGKIIQQGRSCLEIDFKRLTSKQKNVSIEQLRSIVLEEIQHKSWVHHAPYDALLAQAKLRLNQQERAAQDKADEAERKAEWLAESSPVMLAQELISQLGRTWELHESHYPEHEWFEVSPWEIAKVLEDRGFTTLLSRAVIGEEGLLRLIVDLRSARERQATLDIHDLQALWEMEKYPTQGMRITWGLLAIKTYRPALDQDASIRVNALRKRVNTSLKNLEQNYARPQAWDELIGAMFPEMVDGLRASVEATKGHVSKQIGERDRQAAEEKRQLAAEAERLRLDELAQQRRQLQDEAERKRKEHEAEEAAEKARLDRIREVKQAKARTVRAVQKVVGGVLTVDWRYEAACVSLESLLRLPEVERLRRSQATLKVDVEETLRSALASIAKGEPYREWLMKRDNDPKTMATEGMVLRAATLLPRN